MIPCYVGTRVHDYVNVDSRSVWLARLTGQNGRGGGLGYTAYTASPRSPPWLIEMPILQELGL